MTHPELPDPPTSEGMPPSAAPPPTFESCMRRLQEIVVVLERGELPLDESLRLFEEGMRLSKASQERLDAAEKRVDELLSVDAEGRARTAPFDLSKNRDGDASPRPGRRDP